MKNIRKEKGITLIALVITIIVLLILAGVAISMLTGENGILQQATAAKEKTEKATDKEMKKIKSTELQILFTTKNSKLNASNGYVTGVEYEKDYITFLENNGYTVKNEIIYDKNDNEIATIIHYGDTNGDGQCSSADLSIWSNYYKLDGYLPYNKDIDILKLVSDVNFDGIVNEEDIEIIRKTIMNDKIDYNHPAQDPDNIIIETPKMKKERYVLLLPSTYIKTYNEEKKWYDVVIDTDDILTINQLKEIYMGKEIEVYSYITDSVIEEGNIDNDYIVMIDGVKTIYFK